MVGRVKVSEQCDPGWFRNEVVDGEKFLYMVFRRPSRDHTQQHYQKLMSHFLGNTDILLKLAGTVFLGTWDERVLWNCAELY